MSAAKNPASTVGRGATRAHTLGLVVLDSFYNFLPGIDLKDEGAEQIVARLKREVSDATGCTVLIVDHMPWATDSNRGRLRAYGGVFKNAATRFGIYIDAIGKNLSIEARGNNIRGFKKHPAYWDADALELRLVDTGDHDDNVEQRADAALKFLLEHPDSHSTTKMREAIGGRGKTVDQALELLKSRDAVQDHGRDGGTWSQRNGDPRYWIATIHAASHGIYTTSQLPGTGSDVVEGASSPEEPRPDPYRGRGSAGRGQEDDLDEEEIDRREALHIEALADAQREAVAADKPARARAGCRGGVGGVSVRASEAVPVRLALSPDEAAAALGVSRDYLDEHIAAELRWVRRGRRKFVSIAELERWLDEAAERVLP